MALTADISAVEQCQGCGAALAATATWCSQCYLPRSATTPAASAPDPASAVAPVAGERSIMSGMRQQVAARPAAAMIKTRWRKTPTTFGPVGRVLWTLALLLPIPPMVVGSAVGIIFCVIGLGIWLFVIMPWALRDIWKAGQLPAG